MIRVWFVQRNDLDQRAAGVTALDVQRPSCIYETQDQTTRAVFVVGIILDQLDSSRYCLLKFGHADVPNNTLVDGMFGKLIPPLQYLFSDIIQRYHHPILRQLFCGVNLTAD